MARNQMVPAQKILSWTENRPPARSLGGLGVVRVEADNRAEPRWRGVAMFAWDGRAKISFDAQRAIFPSTPGNMPSRGLGGRYDRTWAR
jgi:hypothetical protein